MCPAFTRSSTFLWFAVALAATCARSDLRGVTSFVRALGLTERCYWRLLDMFYSTAVRRDELPALWSRLVLSLLMRFLFCVNNRIVLLADGIKAPKTGRKMPGVKKLHQESQNNSKPEFIFGHSCQAIAVVARAAAGFFAVPLACAIHEGVVFSNRDKRVGEGRWKSRWPDPGLYTHLLDLRSPSWSRSDRMMVAVGFNPRFTAFHEGSRRGATPETTFVVLWHTPTSSVNCV